MNIFIRVLLAIYAFCLTVVSVIAMYITLKPAAFKGISSYISEDILKSSSASIIMFIVELIFLAMSLTFLLSGFKRDKEKRAVSKVTNIGEVLISLDTIENIALTASRRLNGVRESKADVVKFDDSVSIFIKTVVMPDVNIPILLEDIQVKVKKSVEESAGVRVNEVKVMVSNIYTGYKSRVE
ncbi:MAG: alkaline shock response membrane anchor protein AmaP [Clostridia bacterium]|nr:alkaline shock response membrane anchor protein AmaP [Clostridia bacterium]